MIAVVAGFALQMLFGPIVLFELALWPPGTEATVKAGSTLYEVGFRPWQFVTYAFLHGDVMHLAFNTFGLYMFGGAIEATLGPRHFLAYLFTCIVGAAVVHLVATAPALAADSSVATPMVGISGGIYGLLLAYGMLYPRHVIVLLIPPIPMPAWLFVIVFGALELYLGLSQTDSPIAHTAHFGGMAVGFVLLQYWRGKLPIKPKRILMR
jgi:membrane associated rhomboid family serine protease